MSEAMHVRLASPDDAAVLSALNQEFNENFVNPEQVESQLQAGLRSEIVLLVEMNNQTVGFACVQLMSSVCYPHPWAELTELYIQPLYRRRGLGRALVQEAERMAKERGATEIHVRTGVGNVAGQGLYSALGYIQQPHLTFQRYLK